MLSYRLFSLVVVWMLDQSPHRCLLQEGELELEAETAKPDMAVHSETLRDTAPVLEGVKVMSLNIQPVRSVDFCYKCCL